MKYILLLPIILLSLETTAQIKNISADDPQSLPHQSRRPEGMKMGRPRSSGTIYFIDGVRVKEMQEVEPVVPGEPVKIVMDVNTPTSFKLNREDIRTLPYTNLQDMLALSPSVYQLQRGADVSISGSRGSDVLYVIDGMQVARR